MLLVVLAEPRVGPVEGEHHDGRHELQTGLGCSETSWLAAKASGRIGQGGGWGSWGIGGKGGIGAWGI